MRGKDVTWTFRGGQQRITPAYAGKSQSFVSTLDKQIGSPPPMRGKVAHRAKHHPAKRITPAYAGKRKAPVFGTS